MVVSAFSVVFAIGLLRRFLYPILDPLVFVSNTFDTHNLSINGLFQNPGLHACFGLNLNRGLNKAMFLHQHRVLHKPLFYTKTVLYTNTMFCTKTIFLCSCWACASAVCGLQDSSFQGGRRNTPKAVEFLENPWKFADDICLRFPMQISNSDYFGGAKITHFETQIDLPSQGTCNWCRGLHISLPHPAAHHLWAPGTSRTLWLFNSLLWKMVRL